MKKDAYCDHCRVVLPHSAYQEIDGDTGDRWEVYTCDTCGRETRKFLGRTSHGKAHQPRQERERQR